MRLKKSLTYTTASSTAGSPDWKKQPGRPGVMDFKFRPGKNMDWRGMLLIKGSAVIARSFFSAFLFSLIVFYSGCSSDNSPPSTLTCKAVRRNFAITVEIEGVLEAQKSYVLVAPRIWPYRPEISYLALEGSYVKKGDVVVSFAEDKFKADYENALRDLEIARSELIRTEAEQRSQLAQLQAQIESAEASAASARLQLSRLEFIAARDREIKKLEITISETEAAKSRKKLTALEAVQKEERTQKLLEVKQWESRANTSLRNIEQLTLRVPADGYVVYQTNELTDEKVKAGDALYPGMAVVSIPGMDSLQVKLQLRETEVRELKEGQPATITVPSLGDLQLGGHLKRVSKMAQRVRRSSQVKSVEASVVVDSIVEGLVPGLTSVCSIKIGEIADAVVIPLDCVFEKDSLHIVYIRDQGYFKPCRVELGPGNSDFSVVVSGLQGGEELSLKEPPQSLLKKTGGAPPGR